MFAKNRAKLTEILSASADGEIIFWNMAERKPLFQINAHERFVRGLSFANNSQIAADTVFMSSGDDKKINLWSLNKLKEQFLAEFQTEEFAGQTLNYKARATYVSKHMLMGADHSYDENMFATGDSVVQLWNYDRSAPLQSFEWGVDTVTKIKFNPSQVNLLASVANDRSVCLYDIRGNTPINKIYLKNKSAALCWNPQEPMNFVVGNENGNCYTFDMRKPE